MTPEEYEEFSNAIELCLSAEPDDNYMAIINQYLEEIKKNYVLKHKKKKHDRGYKKEEF